MRKIFSLVVSTFLLSLSAQAWAANFSDPIDGVYKGTYGNSISVEVPSLVSKSPVAGEDQNGDLSFEVNASTGYRNFNQLTDLREGDPVRIEYTQDPNGKDKDMVATIITKTQSEVADTPVNVVSTDAAPTAVTTQTVTTTTSTGSGSE